MSARRLRRATTSFFRDEGRHVNSARPSRPVTGRIVLYCLLGFFGVVFAMNLAMVKLAIDTLPGTDVDSAYKASLAYGREIEAAHAQEARRWSVLGHIDRNADGDAAIRVEARRSEEHTSELQSLRHLV